MNERIEALVKSYLALAEAGQEVENSKVDFKTTWWDLTDDAGINEFLKDTTAIANSFGPDGYIIIGYNERQKVYSDSIFKDCKLKDTAQLPGIVNSRVDRLFDFNTHDLTIDGHKLSVIHMPPSLDKPHVIRSYKAKPDAKEERNRIWVRRGTTTEIANKNDLELMYYDRKNIVPEYGVYVSAESATVSFHFDNESRARLSWMMTIENFGRRHLAIKLLRATVEFKGEVHKIDCGHRPNIASNHIYSAQLNFHGIKPKFFRADSDRRTYNDLLVATKDEWVFGPLEIYLTNGKVIPCEISLT